ncbi:MAG: FG-GAP-like repeat-containing protein [Solirubrobacterales bacterium]
MTRSPRLNVLVAALAASAAMLALPSAAAAAVSFAPAANFAAGSVPNEVAVGDLNADGRPDLAVANFGYFGSGNAGNVSVLLATGTPGNFGAPANFAAGTHPTSVAIGDLNSDGRPDLAVANQFGAKNNLGDVSVLLATGAPGSFAAPASLGAGANPSSVAIDDLNGDGRPDLAVALGDRYGELPGAVAVLLAAGSSFADPANFAAGRGPSSVAIGDLNGDWRPDLAVADINGGSLNISDDVSVLLAAGTPGSFAAPASFAAGSRSFSVAIGDLNADGRPDLAVANAYSSNVSVLLAAGTPGSFAAPANFPAGTSPVSVAIGDLNSDGKPDLAVANYDSDNVSVLLNTSQPAIGLAPDTLSFGSQEVGTQGPPQALTVSNSGEARLRVDQVRIVGADPGDFVVHSDYCSGEMVQPGQSCQVLVRFAPTATGLRSASLQITSDDFGSPHTVALSGTGTAPVPADTTPPEVSIDKGPTGLTNDPQPTFEFSADEEAEFECRFDGAAYAPCSERGSHTPEQALNDGPHVFEVRATDAAGNRASAARSFTVDTAAPDTRIESAPGPLTSDSTPSFEFSANKPGAEFECSLDAALFAPCSSPRELGPLADGAHTFRVRAIDRAGNVDPTPASRTFTVDTTPPDTQIDSGPKPRSTKRTPTFTFSSPGHPEASFECKLDAGPFAACTSPRKLSRLAFGSHTFQVRAIDAAGNVDPSPASATFKVVRR